MEEASAWILRFLAQLCAGKAWFLQAKQGKLLRSLRYACSQSLLSSWVTLRDIPTRKRRRNSHDMDCDDDEDYEDDEDDKDEELENMYRNYQLWLERERLGNASYMPGSASFNLPASFSTGGGGGKQKDRGAEKESRIEYLMQYDLKLWKAARESLWELLASTFLTFSDKKLELGNFTFFKLKQILEIRCFICGDL